MADEIDRLLVRVEANAQQFEAQMKRVNRALYGSQTETRKTLNAIKRDTAAAAPAMFKPIGDSFRREIASLSGVLAGLFTTQQVVAYADAWTQGRNALAAAGVAAGDLADRQSQLVDLANETRTSTASTVELYARLTRATSELGMTQAEVLRLTELLNKSFASSGLSTQEAASAALQLSQALASGQLQGDELRSLRENAPAVAQAIADAMGVGIGALKDLGAEGKLTASVVSSAILGAADDIESRFGATTATVGQALTILNNELGRYIGESDQAASATNQMAQAIIALANNLDVVIPAVLTLAGVIGGAYAISLATAGVRTAVATANTIAYQAALIRLQARQTGATAAQIALNAALTANPIGLVVTAIAALSAGLFILATRYNTTAIAARQLDEVVGAADSALEDYRQAVDRAKNASAAERKELDEKAAALRRVTLARINDAKVAAQQQIDEAVAARQRADAEIARSGATRQAVGANAGSNAGAALVGGARSRAQGAISLAVRARQEADTALQAYERLKGAMDDIENPAAVRPGGGGAGKDDGGGSKKNDQDRIADLRTRLELEERLAAARATGDEKAVKAEEERQRLIELTERYREAGYEDAANRALALLAAENQAADIAETRERTQARLAEQSEREANLRQRSADWTERQQNAELEIARLRGDDAAIRRLEREAELRQRIAENTERYGVAGVGLAVGEQLQADQARADGDMAYAARDAARTFVDVIAADDPWEAAGQAFQRAAFNGLEDIFTEIFKGLSSGDGGGIVGAIGSAIGSLFGGGRASGGPVTKGRVYRINENTPNSEWFAPGVNGTVLTNGQVRGLTSGASMAARASQPIVFDLRGAVMTQDLLDQMNQIGAVAAVGAVQQGRTERAQAGRAAAYRRR